MAIEIEQIATNRYAPEGSNAIVLYKTGDSEPLTIGQLAIAICSRLAAANEARSVLKMNKMSANSDAIGELSGYMEKLSKDLTDAEAKAFQNEWYKAGDKKTIYYQLINVYGISESALNTSVESFTARMTNNVAIKQLLESKTQTAQEDMIDLQSFINNRDTAYTASTNIVKAQGGSAMRVAQNFN